MPTAAATATQVVSGSTRWCPTPEQLMILEEMYRGGLRTPNASQIQQITAHLALYGRIEGKNVFYWFQNHKARDRQKLRRRLCMSHHLLSCAHYYAAAAAAGHGHLAAVAGAGAAPPPSHYSSSCGGAGLVDQQGHLLTTSTTPTPAAGYAATYCYPFAAGPPSRCAAPTPTNPLLQYQGEGGGGGVLPEYSLGRLGNLGVVEDAPCAATTVPSPSPSPAGYELAAMADQAMMTMTVPAPAPATAMGFCRPLKTLDLFPGALKEEQRDVA